MVAGQLPISFSTEREADLSRDSLDIVQVLLTRTAWNFIWLGTALRYVQDARIGRQVNGPGYLVENAHSLQTGLGEYGLAVSARVFAMRVAPLIERFQTQPADYVLTQSDVNEVYAALNELRTTMEAEAGSTWLFSASSSRYPINALLVDISPLLGAGVYESLTPIARFDLQSAGSCLAFGFATAAAFHVLRAAEEVLRQLYMRTRTDVAEPVDRLTWGRILGLLQARPTKVLPELVLQHLDNIKNNFRNPTDHPEAIYTIDEAYDVFGLSCEVIGRMAKLTPAAPAQVLGDTPPSGQVAPST